MDKEKFINSKMKLSKEDIIYDYYNAEEKLIEKLGIEHKIYELEQQVKKQKEVIEKIEKYIEKEARIYGFSMSIELGTHFDNILGILKEVSE